MSSFDGKPILTKLGFFTKTDTIPKYQITTPVPINDVSKFVLELSLTGLEHMVPGMEKPYFNEFYLNIAIFYQQGGKGGYMFNNYSYKVTGYNGPNGEKRFDLLVDLFGDDLVQAARLHQDLTYTFFSCSIFYSERKLNNEEEIMSYRRNPLYSLYNSKLPLIGGESNVSGK